MAQKRSFREKLLLAIKNSNYKDKETIREMVKFYAKKLTDDELMAIESLSEWAKKSDELFCQGVDSILNDDEQRNMFVFELAQAYNEKAENELKEQTQKNENLEKQLKEQTQKNVNLNKQLKEQTQKNVKLEKQLEKQKQNSEKIRNAADNQSQKNKEIRGSIYAINKRRKIAVPISLGLLLIGSIVMGCASVFGRLFGISEDMISAIGAAVDAVGLAISVIFFIYEHSSDNQKLGCIDESDQMCEEVKSLAVNINFDQKQDNSVGDGSNVNSPGAISMIDSPGAKVQVVQGDNFEQGAVQVKEQTNYIEN